MASLEGVGDMVIGLDTNALGESVWHSVVQRDGATYDPTMGQWFEPGVYESTWFDPRLTLTAEQVRAHMDSTGFYPDAQNQGLTDGTLQDIARPQTPGFKAWFKGSKVVDENGLPAVQYHATTQDFEAFKAGGPDPTISGPAIWLTPNRANQPAAHNVGGGKRGFKSGTRVMPVYVKMLRPMVPR